MRGTIYKGIGGFYFVMTKECGSVECRARGRFRKERIIPMIGDEVEIEIESGKGFISEILPRRSKLIRPAVANIDMIVVVAAAKSPDPSVAVIDRMLVNAEINEIEPMVCINKSDLADTSELVQLYTGAGYKALPVSAATGEGLNELFSLISGKVAAFAGVSGVGKSSLLSLIIGSELETGAVSDKISRGRHTTRHTELFKVRGGGFVLDTPGFSSIEPESAEPEDIKEFFPEMRGIGEKCRFRGCAHINEPDCAVKAAVAAGNIAKSRYNSYRELFEIQRSRTEWK